MHAYPRHRNAVIVSGVLLLHVVALWALQSGLLRRMMEVVVPVQLVSEFLAPPPPNTPPVQPKLLPTPPAPAPVTPRPAAAPVLPVAPQPVAVDEPSPTAPTGVVAPQPPAPPIAAPVAATPAAPPPAPAPVMVELPSTNADYLHNPKPAYPALSKRAGEQGQVLLRVLIGEDGQPQKAEIKTSSGFERLDRAALATVLQWRYVPGKRGGVAEAMWFNVPINFILE
jgi:periplasmic protein TonB